MRTLLNVQYLIMRYWPSVTFRYKYPQNKPFVVMNTQSAPLFTANSLPCLFIVRLAGSDEDIRWLWFNQRHFSVHLHRPGPLPDLHRGQVLQEDAAAVPGTVQF